MIKVKIKSIFQYIFRNIEYILGMKITPLILFLILLIVLIISMLFGNSLLKKEKEGFVSFGYNNTDAIKINIPQYSSDENKKVTYLYDNLYFDGANSNLIEVDSSFCSNIRVSATRVSDAISGNVRCNDSVGTSIQNIYVTTRNNITKSYPTNTDLKLQVQESTLTNSASNNHFSYLTNCPTISDIPGYKYQLFYASWENNTYMHIMGLNPNLSKGDNIQSYYYDYNSAMLKYVPFVNLNTDVPLYNATYASNEDANNGKLYKDLIFNRANIYQISKYVKYDLVHGCILILNPTSNTYNIYSRKTGQLTTDISSAIVDNIPSLVSWIIPDGNNGMVIVMAQGMNTVIMIITPVQNQKQYALSYCVRFTDKEVYLSSNSSSNLVITTESPQTDISNKNIPCFDELSCKWYYYFKTMGNDPAILFKNDFIRKTQIVPPVCPTCPNCSSSGVCTTCGGNGGSGTTVSDTSSNILRGAANLGKEAVGGAVGLTKDVVGGTVGLTKEVVGGTVGLTKDVVGGAVGLTKDVVGGAVGLVKDTASGIYNLGDTKTKSDSAFGYVPSNLSTPVDQYSYYGSLQSKGGNFMPVTADFSSFRK